MILAIGNDVLGSCFSFTKVGNRLLVVPVEIFWRFPSLAAGLISVVQSLNVGWLMFLILLPPTYVTSLNILCIVFDNSNIFCSYESKYVFIFFYFLILIYMAALSVFDLRLYLILIYGNHSRKWNRPENILVLLVSGPSCEPRSLLKASESKGEPIIVFLYSFSCFQLHLSPYFSYYSQIRLFTKKFTLFSLVSPIPLLSR